MFYKEMDRKDSWGFGRSETYRGTCTNKVDGELVTLKKQVKMNNKTRVRMAEAQIQRLEDYGHSEEDLMESIDKLFDYRPLQRVRLMGRGPRRTEEGYRPYPNIDSYLRHEDSVYFDVYLLDDDTQIERVRDRLRRKFCPTTMKVRDLEWELMQAKWDLQRKQRGIDV
jgi:hypothetical protein